MTMKNKYKRLNTLLTHKHNLSTTEDNRARYLRVIGLSPNRSYWWLLITIELSQSCPPQLYHVRKQSVACRIFFIFFLEQETTTTLFVFVLRNAKIWPYDVRQ